MRVVGGADTVKSGWTKGQEKKGGRRGRPAHRGAEKSSLRWEPREWPDTQALRKGNPCLSERQRQSSSSKHGHGAGVGAGVPGAEAA